MKARTTSTAIYTIAAAVTTLGIQALLGNQTEIIVWRAIGSAVAGGAIVGYLSAPHLTGGSTRKNVIVSAVGGIAAHPCTWILFVLWSYCIALAGSEALQGTLLETLESALIWSVGSITYGAVLTVPAGIGAALLTARLLPAERESVGIDEKPVAEVELEAGRAGVDKDSEPG